MCVQYFSGGVLVRLNGWHTLLATHPRTLAGTQLVNATLQQEALKLPTVSAAVCQVTAESNPDSNRCAAYYRYQ
ncbi:Uncharacterised protein [Escherichia coli]|nr:Uncharacterised protein [Escherichia coli]